jgi:hypothetical protein
MEPGGGTIGSGGDGAAPDRAADDFDGEVIDRHSDHAIYT